MRRRHKAAACLLIACLMTVPVPAEALAGESSAADDLQNMQQTAANEQTEGKPSGAMVMVTSLSGLFRASTSPAATQPTQASRMEAPITATTYSSTSAAVRPAEDWRFFRRRGAVRSRSSGGRGDLRSLSS